MAGIYIHIPFCKQACHYCDFHFSTTFKSYREQLIQSIAQELINRAGIEDVETIYFGGGTPSLLTANEIEFLLETIRNHYQLSTDCEVTLEGNPDDLTTDYLNDLKRLGVHRLSIGIQAFQDDLLRLMNRAHNVTEALSCVQNAHNIGFQSVNVDLIYGIPGLTLEQWQDNLNRILELPIQHVSCYHLTIEPNTVFNQWQKKGKLQESDDEHSLTQFKMLRQTLLNGGFDHYEVSNFCRPGFPSKHNSSYWQGKNYIGIGPSAHSYENGVRRWNVSNNTAYIKGIQEETSYFETETLSDKDRFNELIMIKLRLLNQGVSLTDIQLIGSAFESHFLKQIESFVNAGQIEKANQSYRLTESGIFISDYILGELFYV